MKRGTEHGGYRHERLQGLVLEELRALLRDDVSDPALAGVRVVAVVLSPDYRNARVHFTARGEAPSDGARAERGLLRATPFLRARLTDAIDLKRVPELRFVLDGVLVGEDHPPSA